MVSYLRWVITIMMLCIWILSWFLVYAWLDYPLREWRTILTQQQEDVIGQTIRESENPLRDGTGAIWEWIGDTSGDDSIFFSEISSTAEAWTEFTRAWTWFLNRVLWISWLVMLIYLIYHGMLVVTWAWDEEKIKKWRSWIRTAMIAILWIALAWFLVSIVFWLITLLVT